MARNRQKIDFNFDDDIDLDKLMEDMGFNLESEPPKSTKEAISRTAKDLKRGIKGGLTDSKLAVLGKIAKGAVPDSISSEYGEIEDIVSDVNSIIRNSTEELKKESKTTIDSINKLIPENNKISKILESISKRLGDLEKQTKGPSKEELQNEKIQLGILEALGKMQTRSHADAVIRKVSEDKRFLNSLQVSKGIYGELRVNNDFNFKVAAGYYKRNLEIQYRQLFVQKELLEFTKASHLALRNQIEAVVINTSLPEIAKLNLRNSFKGTFRQRLNNAVIDTFTKKFTPLQTFRDNLTNDINRHVGGFIEGIRGVGEISEQIGDYRELNKSMGQSFGYLLGRGIANKGLGKIGNFIGNKLEKQSGAKRGLYEFKNAISDPIQYAREIENQNKNNKSLTGRAKHYLGKLFRYYGTSPNINEPEFMRQDLNSATIFDGRAHSSITKVIPGLLSKIYGEVKTMRSGLKIGGDPTANEIYFDNTDDTFRTKSEMIGNIKDYFKTTLNSTTDKYVKEAISIYTKAGIKFNKKEIQILSNALVEYMMSNNAAISPNALCSKEFLSTIPDKKIVKKILSKKEKLINYLSSDYFNFMDAEHSLSGIRNTLPNMKSRFEDMYSSGQGHILEELGIGKRSQYNGNMEFQKEGLRNLIRENYDGSVKRNRDDRGTSPHNNDIIEDTVASLSNKLSKTKKSVGRATSSFYNKNVDKHVKNAQKKYYTVVDKLNNVIKSVDTIDDSRVVNTTKQKIKEADSAIGKFLEIVSNSQSEEEVSQAKKDLDNKLNEINKSVSDTRGTNPQSEDTGGGSIKRGGYISLGIVNNRTDNVGSNNFSNPFGSLDNFKGFLSQSLRKIFSRVRKWDEVKDEYFNSEEYKTGKCPTILHYIKAMGYNMEDNWNLKSILKKTRQWDRQMFKATIGGIFKLPMFGFKGLKTGLGLGGKVAGAVTNTALDMLPFGLGTVIKVPFTLMSKTLEVIGLKESKEAKQKKESERKGGWLSRLNIFKKDKDGKKQSLAERAKGFFKDHAKGLTMTAGLLGTMWLLKTLNISFDDVKLVLGDIFKGIKFLGGLFTTVTDAVGKISETVGKVVGGAFNKISSLIPGFGGDKDETTTTENGETGNNGGNKPPSRVEAYTKVGTASAILLGMNYVRKHPWKTVKKLGTAGGRLIDFLLSFANKLGSWGIGAIRNPTVANRVVNEVNAVSKMGTKGIISKFFTAFKRKGLAFAIKAGGKLGFKAIIRIVPALFGVGAVLTGALLAYDLAKVVYYLINGHNFLSSLSLAFLGEDIFEEDKEEIQEEKQNNVGTTATNNATTVTTNLNKTYDKEVKKNERTTKPITKLKYPNYTESPYIKPNPQSSLKGQPADVININPDLKSKVHAFAEEYYNRTGKQLQINSGYRSMEQQQYLYDGWINKKPGFNPAAKPNPNAPHIAGNAVDIQWQNDGVFNVPGHGQYSKNIDETLSKYGLYRPLYKTTGERQHVQVMNSPSPSSDEIPPEMDAEFRQKLVKDSEAREKQYLADRKEKATKEYGKTAVTTATTTTTNNIVKPTPIQPAQFDKGITDVLKQSLDVQVRILRTVDEMKNIMKESKSVPSNTDIPRTPFPESVIDIKRKENFAA